MLVTGGNCDGRRHLGFGRGKGSAAIFAFALRRHRRHLCFGSVSENPPEQSSGLRDRGGLRPGEGPAAAEGLGVPQRGGAQPPLGAAGAAGPGGLRGLRLRQELPLQRLGGGPVPAPADPHPPLPHPALRGPHGPSLAVAGRRFWGVFGAFGVSPDPAELRHRPAGPEPAHHHPQQAAADRHQRPPGTHGAALGGLHGAPLWGGPGPSLHLPHGNRGSPSGLDLRGLGHLQRGPAGPGAAPGGLPGPPPQKGVTPKTRRPKNSPQNRPQSWDFLGVKRRILGWFPRSGTPPPKISPGITWGGSQILWDSQNSFPGPPQNLRDPKIPPRTKVGEGPEPPPRWEMGVARAPLPPPPQ